MRVAGWEFKKARNLFTEILRDPSYDDPSCLLFVIGFVSIFLWQVEPLLWRRGIFRILADYEGKWPLELYPLSSFWLFPFEWVSSALKGVLGLPAVIVYVVNAVLLDRFVAQHGGADASFRPAVLRLRRLLSGVPVLGLCVIPLWRVLWNRKPAWAYRRRTPRLVFQDGPSDPASRLSRGGAMLHSATFIPWILVSNLLALRAVLTWLNEPERSTATSLLVVQGICGTLRIGGMICSVAYVRLRSREGALWGKRKWGLLVCSGAWLLPQSLFPLPLAALLLSGERWGAVVEDLRTRSAPERDADQVIGSRFLVINQHLRNVALDQATLKALGLYREKTFLLMTEVASILMLVLPLRARFPWMNLPGCLVALIVLSTLLSLPMGAVLYVWSFLRRVSGSAEQVRHQAEHPFARYLLLTSMAVVGGANIGVLAGARELSRLGTFLFWIGAYGSAIGFGTAFWGLLKTNEKSLIVWPTLFLSIGMTGHQMRQGSFDINGLGFSRHHVENAAQFHLFKFYLMVPLVLILTVVVGLYRCRWLLRPFRVKDIFNPILSARVRRQLAFLVVTACLPLGGVLVPVWIRLRGRLAGYPLPD